LLIPVDGQENPCMFGPTGCAAGGGLAVIRNEYFANGE